MDEDDAHDRIRQQIERLLGFPGVGPLPAGAIASNLGVLEALAKERSGVHAHAGWWHAMAQGCRVAASASASAQNHERIGSFGTELAVDCRGPGWATKVL